MEKKLIWLDLEMTGLDPNAERIIEIYTCVTNEDLTEIIEGPGMVISQSKEIDIHALIGNIGGYFGLFLGKNR